MSTILILYMYYPPQHILIIVMPKSVSLKDLIDKIFVFIQLFLTFLP